MLPVFLFFKIDVHLLSNKNHTKMVTTDQTKGLIDRLGALRRYL